MWLSNSYLFNVSPLITSSCDHPWFYVHLARKDRPNVTMTRHFYSLFCASLLFGLGCCQTSTDGSTFSATRNKLTKLGTPKSKPRTIQVNKPTRGLLDHVTAKGNTRLGLTYLPDVSVTCSAFDLVVRVKPSFYGFGADESELQLGPNCRSNGALSPFGDLLFIYPLTACGSRKELQRDFIVYKFTLHYEPSTERFPSGAPRIDVDIECRFQRYHHVYQLAVKPTWTNTFARKTLRAHPNEFQIHLMDDSWRNPVKNKVFHLGQRVNVQVSAPHLPAGRRLYISDCYASPGGGSSSSYNCMMDSKRDTGGASQFVAHANGTLRFSFKAFQFIFDPDSEISIHCKLFATSKEPGPAQKSCTYGEDGWKALSGDDSICKCCDSQCVSSKSMRKSMEGSIRSGLMVSDQPLVAEEGLPRVRRLNNPLHDVQSDDILWQNADILKNDDQEQKDYVDDSAGESVILEENIRHDGDPVALQRKRSEASVQGDLPPFHDKGDEGNQNHSNGTEEATRVQSSDVNKNELVDDQELTWYFTWM
ncbi:zona pellucida sperm-binding protein 3 isoform X2 [Hippocampus zosterae]|uniref:zona pellucida sperm-binding protein 3 isoform X2 n=1 Tax=Hippocampus zosterae TaxID=109293 RepID=UPI00223D89B4|nr:zona pellucida sperm-binding protein 3 isoform X2 [Hippocampus zosterae]